MTALRRLGLLSRLIVAVSIGFAATVASYIVLNCPRDQAVEVYKETLRRMSTGTGELVAAALAGMDGQNGSPFALDQPEIIEAASALLANAVPTDGRIELFNRAGRIVYDSGQPIPNFVANQMWFERGRFFTSLLNWWLEPERPTAVVTGTYSATGRPETLAALDGNISDSISNDLAGIPILSVSVPIHYRENIVGALVVSLALPEITRVSRIGVVSILCAATIGFVLAALMLWHVSRQVKNSAERVRQAISHVTKRDSSTASIHTRSDKLLPPMSDAIANLVAYLNARAEEADLFAKEIAHELKNPLTSLRSAVETAERINDKEQHRRLMAVIVQDVVRLDRLISAIAEVSRVDAELAVATGEQVDLEAMLSAIIEIENAASSDPLAPQFTMIEGGAPFKVRGVESRLAQVFRNILLNARSFSPPGARIRIAITQHGGQISITCDDDGPGIPESKEDVIFDRFYSDRPADQPYAGHSGLGLSLCRQILSAHSGTIRAENRLNSFDQVIGARFTVTLPAAKQQ